MVIGPRAITLIDAYDLAVISFHLSTADIGEGVNIAVFGSLRGVVEQLYSLMSLCHQPIS